MTDSLFSTIRTMSLKDNLEIALIKPETINLKPTLVLIEASTLKKDCQSYKN